MKKILLLLFIASSFYGCKKFLDIKPKGFTIPESYEDYAKIMSYAQLAKAGDSYLVTLTDDVQYTDGDSLKNFDGLGEATRRLYTFEGGDIFEEGGRDQDRLWSGSYNRIYAFNTVINNVMDVEDASMEKKKMLRSEALVARAFEFLTLVSVYGKAYDPATSSKDYGIPIIESEDVGDLKYKRKSVAEVYEKIQKDLEEAIPNLMDNVSNSFRPGKNVGHAFRARMYLYMREYDKALADAKAALALNSQLVDLNDYGIKPGNVKIGRITKLPELMVAYPEGIENPENIYVRYAPAVFAFNGNVFASQDLLDVYAKDLAPGEIDKRRALWLSDNSFTTLNFPGRTLWTQYTRANVGLNNMETILIAAEGHARAGSAADLTEAARLYNLLRRHRIGNYTDVVFTNAEDALRKVLDERRREFPFLTTYRYMDLKRLNKESRFAKTITHTANGLTWELPPNDIRYVIPVPPEIRALNPDILEYER